MLDCTIQASTCVSASVCKGYFPLFVGPGLVRFKCDSFRATGSTYIDMYFEFYENGYVLRQHYLENVQSGNTVGPT